MTDVVPKIRAFLEEIGIPYREEALPEDTFLPGILIENGGLTVDPDRLAYPGDLLHEAGHIALTAASERASMNQDTLGSKAPEQSEEIGVILWSFLAARHLGIPTGVVLHAGGYRGASDWYRENFESGTYIGLPLLTWMGITDNPAPGQAPTILSWLRVGGE